MELTFALEPDDYRIFCRRIANRGRNPAPKYKYAGKFVAFIIWVMLGVFFAYLFREMRTTDKTILEVFGPTIAVIFILGILVKIYIGIYQRRMEPHKDGFILGEKTFRFSEAGIEEKAKHYSSLLSWEAVTDVINDPDYIYLFLDVSAAHIIPKRVFDSKEAANTFFERIESFRMENAT